MSDIKIVSDNRVRITKDNITITVEMTQEDPIRFQARIDKALHHFSKAIAVLDGTRDK